MSRKPLITGPIDSSNSVTLAGSKHQLVQPRFEVGAVEPGLKMTRVIVALTPPKEVEDQLQTFLNHQQDRTSPDYHHWLTPEEFGQKFGPAPQDILAVKGWLEQQGLQVTAIAKSGLWMELSGTSAQMENAFQTQMRQYRIAGETHIANASELSIPAALTPVVRGVVSLHNFFKKPLVGRHTQARINGDGTYTPISPNVNLGTGGAIHALVPGDYATIYDLNPLYLAPTPLNGARVQIGLVARSDISIADYDGFRTLAGLPPGNIANVLTLLPDPGFDPTSGDALEATLDAEWSGGVAPGANISVIVSASTATTDGVDLSSAYAVDNNLTDILSVSFGQCEAILGPAENAFINSLWLQAAAQGMSVFVSAGDNGAAACDPAEGTTAATHGLAVSGLASTPFNTAVGGTQFSDPTPATFWSATNGVGGVSALGYIPETVWNESCNPNTVNSPCAGQGFFLDSGSGGKSTIYPKPAWQVGFSSATDTFRDIPDVSLSAAGHDGYVICFAASCDSKLVGVVGGTSASSPSFAGIMAIVDQALGGRQGLANYALYRLATGPSAVCSSSLRTVPTAPVPAGCIFNDVTTGNNSVPGLTGFSAVSGFDLATGLGSVNAANLVSAWKLLTSATTSTTLTSGGATTITGTHGTPVPLTVNVTAQNAPPPTGAVGLVSSLTGTFGSVDLTSPATGVSGTFTGSLSNLPGGAYFLTAHYPGDSVNGASDSAPISVTITSEASTTNLIVSGTTAPASSFPYGSFMELRASVTGTSGNGAVTGFMDFMDSNTLIGSRQMDVQNEADLFVLPGSPNPIPLTPGPHTLIASYEGNQSFRASVSTGVNVTITKGTPGVAVVPPPVFAATQATLLRAAINTTGPITATGTIQFLDSGVALGNPVPVTGNSAGLTTTFATEGQHSITASYSGDNTYNGAVSAAFLANVVAPFAFGANITSATVAAGQTAIYNLALDAPNPASTFAGTVALSCSGAPAGTTCSINPASITFPTANNIVPFTVIVATTTSAAVHPAFPFRGLPVVFAGVLALAVSLKGNRKHLWQLGLVAVLAFGISSCGGSKTVTTPVLPPTQGPTNATIVVTGTSGTHTTSINLQLTITH